MVERLDFFTLFCNFESPWKLFTIRFNRWSFIFTQASAIKRKTSNRNVNTKKKKWKTFDNHFSRRVRWSTPEIFWKHLFVNLAFLVTVCKTVLSSLCIKFTESSNQYQSEYWRMHIFLVLANALPLKRNYTFTNLKKLAKCCIIFCGRRPIHLSRSSCQY